MNFDYQLLMFMKSSCRFRTIKLMSLAFDDLGSNYEAISYLGHPGF